MAETEEDQQTPPKTIELHEAEEGELKQSSNYIFQQIGSPLRLNPNSSSFDLENPPTQALAISHKPQSLLFLAHSKGFYVAKTVEVVTQAELAKKDGNNKSCCIEEFCVVDVQIGKIRSLAVSKDSSTLAVCVGAEVHFFSIASLLNKEQEPFLSCAIDDSSYVKDFRWRKKLENSFLVLGSDGKLYYGDLESPLKEVMENVDAVEWSPEGNFMAVAKEDSLSIFSPRFREQFTMSMPSSLVVTDTDSECTIKVDSISWIREDCIILGCFQIVGDGEENGYLIQVVSCKEGSISEGSSALVIVSFNEAFVAIDDGTLPFGCGPYLFLNYLEHGNVAFLANKKSIDAHIQVFSWSLDAIQKEVVQVDLIQDDKYLPRILYQENEDDNMIMGFGVDTISLREKNKVTLEVESKELSPYCILLCLTLDEKLLMFYVADATVSDDSRKIASPFSDEVEKTSAAISLSCDGSDTSSRSMEHNVKETTSDAQSLKMRRDELETDEGSLVLKGHESQTPDLNDSSKKSTPSPQPSISEREGSLVLKGHEPQTPDLNDSSKKSTPSPQPSISERESLRLDKSTLAYGSDSLSKDSIMLQKPFFSSSGVLGASTGSTSAIFQSKPKDPLGSDEASNLFSKNIQRDGHQSASLGSHSSHKLSSDSLGGNEANNLLSRNFQRDGLQSASSGSYLSHKLSSSNEFNSRLSSTEIKKVEQSGSRVQSTVNVTGNQSSSDPRFGNNLNTRESNSVPQFSTNVSGRSTHIGGQKSSAGATKFASEPGMRSSQVSPYGGSSSQNTQESKLQPPDEKVRSPQLSYGVTSEREFSKHFGNVNEMAKELDFLLSGIEKEGGFRDACIMFQEDSVLGIEQDLENLTKRCRVLKSMMEERFEGVHNLLDQTVQVLARKIYVEGIVKQASDSQYWDLWDRQKLTPELELKRKQILKVNQNLTNQLIELERHFNTLELNKFGENNEVRTDRRVLLSSSKSSRDGQAFHKLYNTMNSQLAAAEHLSECLTKQMAVLNIESPSAKRKSVAKELFESIGLSYDGDSFKSPNVKNVIHSPESVKILSVSSARGATKDQSRRNPSSVVKNFESETARRRVSLDRSWASFTPPKTTVKRMLLQEERPRMNADKSSLVANKESVKQISPVAHLRDHKNFSVPLPSYVNKDEATSSQVQAARDNEDEASKQVPFKWTKDLSGKSLSATMKSPALQVNQGSNLLSSSLPCETQNITNEIIDRPAIGRTRVNKFDQSSVQTIPYSNATPTLFTESSVNRNSATTSLAPNRTPQISANVQSGLNHKDTQTKSISHAVNHREASQEIAVNAPVKSHEPELTPSASPAVVLDKGVFQNEAVKKDTQLGLSPVNPVSVSPSSPSLPETIKAPVLEIPTPLSIPPSSTSSLSLVKSEDSFKTSTNAEIPSTSSFSSSSHSNSPLSFSFQTGNQQFNPSISSATTNISSQVHSTDVKTTTPLMEPKPSVGQLSLKSDVNASQASPLRSEPPSAAPASTAFVTTSLVTDVKNESSDLAATQEDEMEEEASDTTTDLNLGSLGGFGLGSTPTSAVPKSNLFGNTFQNTAATSSFNLTVPSGELFRPASFSIQPIQPSQPASQSAFSSQFTASEPARSGFGQPAQIGSGQQALGSVLGSFGQSRQLGITPPVSGFTSTAGLGGGGFANTAPGFGGGGGFSGGFAAAAPAGGGFAGVGSGGGGGFAGAASGGGGGFAGAGSGGFGSFSNQQGGSAFSSFGGSSAGSGNPNPLFTQMRK